MITIVYRLIVVLILAFVVINLYSENDTRKQANNALIIIPLILRALMIK